MYGISRRSPPGAGSAAAPVPSRNQGPEPAVPGVRAQPCEEKGAGAGPRRGARAGRGGAVAEAAGPCRAGPRAGPGKLCGRGGVSGGGRPPHARGGGGWGGRRSRWGRGGAYRLAAVNGPLAAEGMRAAGLGALCAALGSPGFLLPPRLGLRDGEGPGLPPYAVSPLVREGDLAGSSALRCLSVTTGSSWGRERLL